MVFLFILKLTTYDLHFVCPFSCLVSYFWLLSVELCFAFAIVILVSLKLFYTYTNNIYIHACIGGLRMFETGRSHRLLLETIWSVKKNNYTCMTVSGRLVGLGYIYQPLNHSVRWDNKPHCQLLKDDRNASRAYILNSHLQYNGWMLHL